MISERYIDIVRDIMMEEVPYHEYTRERIKIAGNRDAVETIMYYLYMNDNIPRSVFMRAIKIMPQIPFNKRKEHSYNFGREYYKFHTQRVVDIMRGDDTPMNDYGENGKSDCGKFEMRVLSSKFKFNLIVTSLSEIGLISSTVYEQLKQVYL